MKKHTGKIKAVEFNNKNKTLQITYDSGKKMSVHYGQLGLKKNVSKVWVDKETNGRSVGISFEDGSVDYMPYDQPLAINKDPEYMLQNQIEKMIAQIELTLKKKKISKRYLATQLKTSDNQIQRLLNPNILNKNLEQLYRLTSLVGLDLEWQVKDTDTDEAA